MSTTGTPEAGGTSGLFTRQSSGLVRELGVPAATAIALASVAVVNTFINFSAGLTSFSHPDMVLPLLLAAGIWFVGMFAYRYLLQAIPRAGGEYVYVSSVGSFSKHPNAYNAVLSAAKHNGVVTGISLTASLLVVPFMVLNYNGVLYSYYVGGELKRPGRTYVWASVISIVLLVVVWVGIWVLLRWRVGLDFMQAQANLNAVNGDAYGNISNLSAQAGGLGYGLVLSGDPITKIL